jgi:hypothetical protein
MLLDQITGRLVADGPRRSIDYTQVVNVRQATSGPARASEPLSLRPC